MFRLQAAVCSLCRQLHLHPDLDRGRAHITKAARRATASSATATTIATATTTHASTAARSHLRDIGREDAEREGRPGLGLRGIRMALGRFERHLHFVHHGRAIHRRCGLETEGRCERHEMTLLAWSKDVKLIDGRWLRSGRIRVDHVGPGRETPAV